MVEEKEESIGRKPKGPIKFQIQLNEEQSLAKQVIFDNTVTILKGQAGSGKSLLAAQVALDMLFKKDIGKVIITRPTVEAAASIGFLPGSKEDKLAPFTAPIFDNMYRLYNKEKIDKLIEEGKIEICPLGFMRGRNFSDCLVLVDESQNITHDQMRLVLGRICKGSKMILCGDSSQIDLKEKKTSGFDFICKNFIDVPKFAVVILKQNHRDPIVEAILEVYKRYED
jgi:phosphate starvation-inducible protein PhoH and related proteins